MADVESVDHKTVRVESMACKICGAPAHHFVTTDFHKNAKLHFGLWCGDVKASGRLVDYYRCTECGFLFTPFFDDWTQEMLKKRVYNEDYPRIDGDYAGQRGASMANLLLLALTNPKELAFLDYGSGEGVCSLLLKKHGVKTAHGYDPFTSPQRFSLHYDAVTAQEVMEHVTDPRKTVADLLSFRASDGIIIATTNLVPEDIEAQKDNWWYLGARGGHCSFYTKKSLMLLYRGLNVVFVGEGMHIVYDKFPSWGERLFPPGARKK